MEGWGGMSGIGVHDLKFTINRKLKRQNIKLREVSPVTLT